MNRFFRTISIIFTAVFALNFMTGCSSLQEVNIESLVYSPEIVEFESRLAFLDAASISKNYEAVDFNKKCMELISDIEKASFNPSLKKAALARLYALEGRTYILGGEMTSKAKKLYEQGMETYKGDVHVIIPPIWCTTDNAAMIAKVGEYLYREKIFAPLDISVDPSWKIEDFKKF